MLLKFIRKGTVSSCHSVCPKQTTHSLTFCFRLLENHSDNDQRAGRKKNVMQKVLFFLVWFQSRLGCRGYEVMAALGGSEVPSLGGGTWGVCVPLHERTELHSAEAWPRLPGDGERLHLM